jgi:hypothetical protein
MLCCPVLVETSATGWSLVQRSPTVCLYVCVIKKPQYRGGQGWSLGCSAIGKEACVLRLCLTQVDRWRHSVSDVVEYVTTEKVTRIYFQHTYCIHTPVGNSNTLGLYCLIISYVEAFFLKERMNISDSLHKLRISHRMSFSHYKQNTCVSQI